jgi:carbonic anhydrase/acetyltransferase-like protein (isoleucine patch superfamily)
MLYSFDGNQPVVGKNTYVSETAQVIGDVVIGDNCYVGHGAILRGDYGRIEIGSGTAVEEGVIAHSPPGFTLTMGKSVTLGHGAILHGKSIGDYAVIGMGAVVSIFSEVGEWAIVAEGAVVKMNQIVPDNVVVGGSPAKVVRDTSEKDKEMWTHGKQIYVDLAKKYLEIGMHQV